LPGFASASNPLFYPQSIHSCSTANPHRFLLRAQVLDCLCTKCNLCTGQGGRSRGTAEFTRLIFRLYSANRCEIQAFYRVFIGSKLLFLFKIKAFSTDGSRLYYYYNNYPFLLPIHIYTYLYLLKMPVQILINHQQVYIIPRLPGSSDIHDSDTTLRRYRNRRRTRGH
jgi:hypothetical protein